MSQGTGIFGGLVFLDPRENAFCVPVNRVSSVLGVLVASLVLAWGWIALPSPGAACASAVVAATTIAVTYAERGLTAPPRDR